MAYETETPDDMSTSIRSHAYWEFTTASDAASGDTTSWNVLWLNPSLSSPYPTFTLNWQWGVEPVPVVDEESTGGSGALLWIIIGVVVVGGAAAAYFLM